MPSGSLTGARELSTPMARPAGFVHMAVMVSAPAPTGIIARIKARNSARCITIPRRVDPDPFAASAGGDQGGRCAAVALQAIDELPVAAVLAAHVLAGSAGYRFAFSPGFGPHAAGLDALSDKVIADRFGTLPRQVHVVRIAADAIRMTDNVEAIGCPPFGLAGQLVELRRLGRPQHRAVVIEQRCGGHRRFRGLRWRGLRWRGLSDGRSLDRHGFLPGFGPEQPEQGDYQHDHTHYRPTLGWIHVSSSSNGSDD